MSQSTYFVQECPTCGRNLQVRVEYLGKRVTCRHCSAIFEASDGSLPGHSNDSSGISLLDRADALLASASRITSGLGTTSRSK